MSQTRFYHFPEKGPFYGIDSLDEAVRTLKEDGFEWFNFYKPDREDLNRLVDAVGIHPLSVEDCFDEKQLPKIEHFQNNSFMIFNSFIYINKELFIDEIDIFIGKKFLITVSGHNTGDRDPLNGLTGILETGKLNTRGGPDILMHKIIDFIVDEKYKAFDQMEDELEEAEDMLLDSVETFEPVNLMRLRRNLMSMRKSLFHEREILVKIARKDCPFISDKAVAHYRDIYDHLAKFFELSETYRETETSLMELYSSLLNNHMTMMSNQTNASVRRLTLIATIFLPLTLLASIGGMSEFTLITGEKNWKFAYPLFILGLIVIGLINLLILKRLEKRKRPE